MGKKVLVVLAFFQLINLSAQTKKDTVNRAHKLDEVVVRPGQILGSKLQAQSRTGSAYFLSPEELKRFGHTDINRMLQSVPGVNIYEEDGFGLRPNISLRGTKAERSERITLMEDGILAAPAPYAAPAAYYFPNAARMHAVEVLKGSSQVQYGPFTTGGAINMLSTPIPTKFTANLDASFGSYNTIKTRLMVGNKHKYMSYMAEYLRFQSDGFKRLTNGDKRGLLRNDIVAKFAVHTAPDARVKHHFELKGGYANENSDETYVGLTAEDFAKMPFQRYLGSQMDNIQTKHVQVSATYYLQYKALKWTTQAYHNYFHRNWYKLNDVQLGVDKSTKRSIGDILELDESVNTRYLDILRGTRDFDDESLIVRANNRSYYASGVQSKVEHRLKFNEVYLNLEGGLRFHKDSEDRFQWDDTYAMTQGKMHLVYAGLHGSESNRILTAHAFSSYLLSKLNYKWLTLTAGLRYEHIDLLNKDFGKVDLGRTGMQRIETKNHAQALIPSAGVNVRLNRWSTVFFGIHKGFAPPGVSKVPKVVIGRQTVVPKDFEQQRPEHSINMELGTRIKIGNLRAELIGFYNDYHNMLGSDLTAVGGTGTLDQFNIGKAKVYGAEALLSYRALSANSKFKLPIQLSYTYTNTEMLNSFVSNSWGKVDKGDEIPYIYKHALSAQIGLEHKWFALHLISRYNSDMRTKPGQGLIAEREKIPAHFLLDFSASIHFNKYLSLRVNAINLTNKTYLVSRHPAGLRAGHPFGIHAGVVAKL